MENIKFKNAEHKAFFYDCLEKATCGRDPYRVAMFYTLGLMEETRRQISSIYDFEDRSIRIETAFEGGWHTSGTKEIVRMAFNLYNNFCGYMGEKKIDEPGNYTPYELFAGSFREYFLEAVRLRFEV